MWWLGWELLQAVVVPSSVVSLGARRTGQGGALLPHSLRGLRAGRVGSEMEFTPEDVLPLYYVTHPTCCSAPCLRSQQDTYRGAAALPSDHLAPGKNSCHMLESLQLPSRHSRSQHFFFFPHLHPTSSMVHILCYGTPTRASSPRPVPIQTPGGPANTLFTA